MDSASSGAEQFMYRAGQIRLESNVLWHLEYKGYHGLKSVSDIFFVTSKQIVSQSLSPSQILDTCRLCLLLKPLVKDIVCFQLISMIMMLDTYNVLNEAISSSSVNTNTDSNRKQQQMSEQWNNEGHYSHESAAMGHDTIASSSEISPSTSISPAICGGKIYSATSHGNNSCLNEANSYPSEQVKSRNTMEHRFREIKALQNHYINLLRSHIKYSNNKYVVIM